MSKREVSIGDYARITKQVLFADPKIGTVLTIKKIFKSGDLNGFKLDDNAVYIAEQLEVIPKEIYESPLYKAMRETDD